MSYQNFFAAIASSDLKKVAQHWQDARGTAVMPGWNDIQPARIAAQLPMLWVYRYDRDTDLFTGRLAGHNIESVFGQSFQGTPMTEIYPPEDYPRLFARAKRVTCEPAFYRGEGMVFRHVDHYGHGERIMMPLAADGATGDGVLGATVYQSVWRPVVQDIPESEVWFPL